MPRIHVRDWQPPDGVAARASALIVHGLGEHVERYDHVARRLAARGIAVRGYDHAGHGRSEGPRGGIAHPESMLDDLRATFAELARDAASCSATAWAERSRPGR